MSEPYAQVSVRIHDKMREIRDSGRVVGLDRIAVMAALNMANELIHAEARDRLLEGDVSDRLKLISDRVENVLGESQQLDL
jgi:cell division protein ZapA